MFIGHFGVGFALKRVAPRTSLGVLIAAPQVLDLLWPWFLLLGWERVRIDPGNTAVTPLAFDSYPISHSLLMAAVWGLALALLYIQFGKANGTGAGATYRRRVAVWLAIAVVSHWVFDWITHRPDMPIVPWSDTKVGLGLWNSVPGTVIVEAVIYAAGVWIYARTTRARDRMGAINFWIYVVVLAAIYAGNLLGPPPPDPRSLALVAIGLWLFPLWAAWVDRHRSSAR
jgi:membrane-bound metal-dependent hydrolase YbcI (DUF457 family)